MITLFSDRKMVSEMNKLKILQARWKASGIKEIKDDELDRLGAELKKLTGTQEKEKAFSLAKKYNHRLELLLNERETMIDSEQEYIED